MYICPLRFTCDPDGWVPAPVGGHEDLTAVQHLEDLQDEVLLQAAVEAGLTAHLYRPCVHREKPVFGQSHHDSYRASRRREMADISQS